jgi:molybdopterin-guanine dinucleotide biosynthesis protein A
VIELLVEHDIAVPVTEGFHHPLAAVYRRTVLPAVEKLLGEDRMRPVFLFDECDTRRVTDEELRSVDPQLSTLENLNRPEDYLRALERAGFEPTADVLEKMRAEP